MVYGLQLPVYNLLKLANPGREYIFQYDINTIQWPVLFGSVAYCKPATVNLLQRKQDNRLKSFMKDQFRNLKTVKCVF